MSIIINKSISRRAIHNSINIHSSLIVNRIKFHPSRKVNIVDLTIKYNTNKIKNNYTLEEQLIMYPSIDTNTYTYLNKVIDIEQIPFQASMTFG